MGYGFVVIDNPWRRAWPGRKKRFTTTISGSMLRQSNMPNIIFIIGDDGEDEEEDEDEEEESRELYKDLASSEFSSDSNRSAISEGGVISSDTDWGGALTKLRSRVSDIESGQSQKPSRALFRIMTSSSPNEAISKFVNEADPEILQAMSSAVSSLLGGLSNPAIGIETIVRAPKQQLGSLCFQLQMTGYMFRNAEYVVALKKLMNLGPGTINDYRTAFNKLDTDGSGFIEASEIYELLADVYDGNPPKFEIEAFMRYFDKNKDGRICWNEFEKGLGLVKTHQTSSYPHPALPSFLGSNEDDEDGDDDDEYPIDTEEPTISGTVEIEVQDGKFIQIEARDYIADLKREVSALKQQLAREKKTYSSANKIAPVPADIIGSSSTSTSITAYIASLGQENIKTLTEGISPDVVEAMKLLVNYVIDDEEPSKPKPNSNKFKDQQEGIDIPGSALQQLALWQMILGYRLREAEATDDYKKLMEN